MARNRRGAWRVAPEQDRGGFVPRISYRTKRGLCQRRICGEPNGRRARSRAALGTAVSAASAVIGIRGALSAQITRADLMLVLCGRMRVGQSDLRAEEQQDRHCEVLQSQPPPHSCMSSAGGTLAPQPKARTNTPAAVTAKWNGSARSCSRPTGAPAERSGWALVALETRKSTTARSKYLTGAPDRKNRNPGTAARDRPSKPEQGVAMERTRSLSRIGLQKP